MAKISRRDFLKGTAAGAVGIAALGFAPQASDAALFDAQPWDGGEDYRLFIMGDSLRDVQTQGLCFPALSHA